MKKDKTLEAVEAQVEAMGCATFEVGVFDAEREKMLIKIWDKETVLKSVPYLKYQNMQGRHIYIRPGGEHDLTLVDDLKQDSILQMKNDGIAPAVVVETSPKNFQVWVKHHEKLSAELSTQVSKSIAETYDGDSSSADWRHYGRLAGFTNCKVKYKQANGLYPFVTLHEATGIKYETAPALVAAVEERVKKEKAEEQERRAKFSSLPPRGNLRKSINDFRHDPRYNGDFHRAELGYATYALSRGASEENVIAAIMTRDLSHKGGANRQMDYAERTVKKALNSTQGIQAPAQSKGRG